GLNIQSTSSIIKILGSLSINNALFKPSNNILGLQIEYITSMSNYQLYNLISKLYNSQFEDITHYTTINKYGFVDPVKKMDI
ncbi:MAG: hypothetical protein ACKPKO_51860, partial [Candidatus Fonsibacter sp.]